MLELRKRYRVVLFAAIAAAVAVPVGYALSLESPPATPYGLHEAAATTTSAVVASRVLHPEPVPAGATPPPSSAVPGAAKLLLVGTTLLGLAAAVRRTI